MIPPLTLGYHTPSAFARQYLFCTLFHTKSLCPHFARKDAYADISCAYLLPITKAAVESQRLSKISDKAVLYQFDIALVMLH
jgi:hypothetical protein